MRIIDRYICREVFSYALLGLAVFTFVFFVPQLVRLMELVVRHSADAATVALLFLCTLPPVLTFTLPMGVLVGVLIGLGRMSADNEIIALHALGIGLRRLLVPIGALALFTAALTSAMTFWLGPTALRTFRSLEEQLRASQASLQVQPRVFDERFPGLVLYVQDVEAGGTDWRGVLLADAGDGPDRIRAASPGDASDGIRITLAEQAIILADRRQGKVQLHLRNGSTHQYGRREPDRYGVTTFGESDLAFSLSGVTVARAGPPSVGELPLPDLLDETGSPPAASQPGQRALEARVELHRRIAFPAACLVFALLAIPVGVRPHRGGRAAGLIATLILICGYYLLFVAGAGLARRGVVPVALGIWTANLLTALGALVLLPRMEEIGAGGTLERWREAFSALRGSDGAPSRGFGKTGQGQPPAVGAQQAAPVTAEAAASPGPSAPRRHRAVRATLVVAPSGVRRGGGLPLLIDLYVLRHFFGYLVLMLAGFLLLFQAFTFFELLNDIVRHAIPASVVADYFLYLTPHLIYQLLPLAALVAVLSTVGAMAKHNEMVAFRASGVSLYRLSLPLLVCGVVLAAGMFFLDDTYLPYANQRQDALRNQMKGRPAQTFHQPRRQWIFGGPGALGLRVYHYEFFDSDRDLFAGLHLYELDPATFQLRRRVFAARAHFEASLDAWVLEEGWVRDFAGTTVTRYETFRVVTLPEMAEPPSYFKREVRQSYQMNWRELRQYIGELKQAGFDVTRLSVHWHKKFAYPLITPVVLLLAFPFALRVGTRGAVSGLALGVGIAIVYWAVSALLEAMGAVGQLPASVSGWAPDAIFTLLGVHFFLKMET